METQIRSKCLVALLVLLFHATIVLATVEDNKLDKAPKISDLPKKSRFISFNNDEGEVKVELDFAVPFIKIPTSRSRSGTNELKPGLNVNVNGLATVGAMLFLFVTVVPKVVQLFIPQAQVTATENLIPLMGKLDDALRSMDISTTDCYQRSACWIASNSLVKYPFSSTEGSSSQWLRGFIENEAMQDAFQNGLKGGDCAVYKCPLSMNAISQIIKIGRSAFTTKEK
ncbi:Hypothetical protein NTJ_03015 [Nesidiocoris tenuis]|uniref:Uncharacterized protein n=1 Tax=Nesidiocoris tenuis TaxID=355587 RepID=A0ABN7AD28_9HEMI|nr:Hypothetical protein NTJ_03015 [Nesidiocoris tenuis]